MRNCRMNAKPDNGKKFIIFGTGIRKCIRKRADNNKNPDPIRVRAYEAYDSAYERRPPRPPRLDSVFFFRLDMRSSLSLRNLDILSSNVTRP